MVAGFCGDHSALAGLQVLHHVAHSYLLPFRIFAEKLSIHPQTMNVVAAGRDGSFGEVFWNLKIATEINLFIIARLVGAPNPRKTLGGKSLAGNEQNGGQFAKESNHGWYLRNS